MYNYLKSGMLQSFRTNDGVKLSYIDTGAGQYGGAENSRDWLILVCLFTFCMLCWLVFTIWLSFKSVYDM